MSSDSVLLVEDEFLIAELLSIMLADMGLKVCANAATVEEAVVQARRHLPRLALVDVRLKGAADGVVAAAAIHEVAGSRIIFITGSRDSDTMKRMERTKPAGVLFKPVEFNALQKAVREAMA